MYSTPSLSHDPAVKEVAVDRPGQLFAVMKVQAPPPPTLTVIGDASSLNCAKPSRFFFAATWMVIGVCRVTQTVQTKIVIMSII